MTTLEYALQYARQGWAVFPLHAVTDDRCTCGKLDCTSPGKHPVLPGGFKIATKDPDTIRHWWSHEPFHNVGIATGSISGLLVVDVDEGAEKEGEISLMSLEDEIGSLPRNMTSQTGGGGQHIFFQMPEQPVRGGVNQLGKNIDVRADGGYVVAPPSSHISGKNYEWNLCSELPKAPTELVEKLTKKKVTSANFNAPPGQFLSEGSRNNKLASIAGYFRGQHGLNGAQLESALLSLNAIGLSPLSEDEVTGIARSISNYPAGTRVEYDDGPLAKRLAPEVAKTSCRTPATGWLRFDGKRWTNDSEGAHAKELIKNHLEEFYQEAVSSGDLETIKQARVLRTASKIKKVFDLVSTDPRVFQDFRDFDQQEAEINLANGTLCLSGFSLRPHSPIDRFTRLADVEFDPDATCPEFDRFISTTLSDELGDFVLRLFGYSLLGNPKEQVFTIFHGPGSNGKSTLVDTIASVLGDYSTNVEPSSFIRQKNAGVRDDLARLKGARMVATSELATGEILDAALVKRMTGGDVITARALYKEHFEFRPQFVIFMTTNAMPVIDGGDRALARRLVMVPFTNVISAGQRDSDLPSKIRSEKSGILNRLIEGLISYRRAGLNIPEEVADEVDRYVASSDLIRAFLDERCCLAADDRTPALHLYNAYQGWASSNGTKPLSQPIFKLEVTKRTGIMQKRTSKGLEWPGIGMRPPRL